MAHWHNSFINTRNGSDVWIQLALMVMSFSMIILIFSISLSIMEPNKDSFRCRSIDLFWDSINVVMMKTNQYDTTIFRTFSIQTPGSIYGSITLEIKGANHPLRSSKIFFHIVYAKKCITSTVHPNTSIMPEQLDFTFFARTTTWSINVNELAFFLFYKTIFKYFW